MTLSACDIDGMISYLFISEHNVVFANILNGLRKDLKVTNSISSLLVVP